MICKQKIGKVLNFESLNFIRTQILLPCNKELKSRACNTRYAADGDVVDDTFTSIDDGDGSSKVQNSLKVSADVEDFLFPILTADCLEIWNNRVTCYRWTC